MSLLNRAFCIFNALHLIVLINSEPLPFNYAKRSDIAGSLRPRIRSQRSFNGFYPPNEARGASSRNFHRRNAYAGENPYPPQGHYEPEQPYRRPPPQGYDPRDPRYEDQSQLVVLPRGVDEDYALYPLKTKMLEGFDEEDQDLIHEEEMGDALSYVDRQTPTRYASQPMPYRKPPMPTARTFQMEMAPPTAQRPRYQPPTSAAYKTMPSVMIPQPDDLQYPPIDSYQQPPSDMYQQPTPHIQQKRYQSNHQYYQRYSPPMANDDYYQPEYYDQPNEYVHPNEVAHYPPRHRIPYNQQKPMMNRRPRPIPEIIDEKFSVEELILPVIDGIIGETSGESIAIFEAKILEEGGDSNEMLIQPDVHVNALIEEDSGSNESDIEDATTRPDTKIEVKSEIKDDSSEEHSASDDSEKADSESEIDCDSDSDDF